MQTTNATYDTLQDGAMRPIDHRFLMSFDKTFDANIDFFTIEVSSIGSTDIIAGDGEVIQEWDKYAYTEYSDRVISLEWTRQQDNPYSANLGLADIVLDNHDDYFTPGAGSEIDGDILPQRPVRIYAGFGAQLLQVFIGITEGMPELDVKAKTAKFHCIDFLQTLYNRPLDEAVIYQDMRVDEVLGELVESLGLGPTQYDFDAAFTTIPFAFFDKGVKFGEVANKLVQADLGYLYMDEGGMLTYKNRQNFEDTAVASFTDATIKEQVDRKQDDIVNVVEVKSEAREVQASQKIWESTEAVLVPVGQTVEVWADFSDPVTSVDDPVNIASATSSFWQANTLADGSGANYTDMTVVTTTFSKSFKMEFENTGASSAFLTNVTLHGTPATVVRDIYIRQQDDVSVADFDERVLTIDNEYIQDESTAQSLALITLSFFSEFGGVREIDVKGNPALQLRDPITVNAEDYYIRKQVNAMQGGSYSQRLEVEKRTVLTYFTIEVSTIGGGDVISP